MSEEQQLVGSNYQIIRKRLSESVGELSEGINKLNDQRKEVFGSYEMELVNTERVSTASNTVAWDLFSLDSKHFLFGFNVEFGLKAEISVSDVFNCYAYNDGVFVEKKFEFFENKTFLDDFANLYKFYKNTKFVKFHKIGIHLYMVFRVGKQIDDVKCFKWVINEGNLDYVDARSDHEYKFEAQHDFTWKKTTRDQHRNGAHAHVSLDDLVYVETIGGDLTIKVEDNTSTGKGIYSEPVDNSDQTLDDADIFYANLGNLILIKIKPYQEDDYRYFIFNVKVQEVRRVDAIKDTCVLLPEDQGVIFSTGYYLQTGEFKLFDNDMKGMNFLKKIPSANGEDYLYTFYEKETGTYLLVIYNMIEQEIQVPLFCHGYALFESGQLFLFKSDATPKKNHAFQIWKTPFISEDIEHEKSNNHDSFLAKIGNKDIVRAMAEMKEVIALADKEDNYEGLYVDIYKGSNDVLDAYHWLSHPEGNGLNELVTSVRDVSKSAIDEFEKVVRQKNTAKQAIETVRSEFEEIKLKFKRTSDRTLQTYIATLSEVRQLKGKIVALAEVPLIDTVQIETLKKEVETHAQSLSNHTIEFLSNDNALIDYEKRIEDHQSKTKDLSKVVDCNALEEEVSTTSIQLETLIDIVSNLQIDDSTKATAILDEISGLYTHLNALLADIRKQRKALRSSEGKSEFKAQLNLLSQSLLNFIDLSDTISKCDEYLAKLLVQLEELEGKFSDFDAFILEIETKREEIYNAFETKKSQLKDTLNKRIQNLFSSGERVLSAAGNRLQKFDNESDINSFIASDIMVEKLRRNIEELENLGDFVKSESLQSKLKVLHEEALRNLRDKKDLYEDGTNLIKFGEHKFLVNEQELTPSLIYQDHKWQLHLSGSGFYEQIDDSVLGDYKSVWDQAIVSENKELYRAEYLAFDIYNNASVEQLLAFNTMMLEELKAEVTQEISSRLDEGYTRGVHDHDTALILKELITLHFTAGDLVVNPIARVLARWFWMFEVEETLKEQFLKRLKGAGLLLTVFPDTKEFDGIKEELHASILNSSFVQDAPELATYVTEATNYLFQTVASSLPFIISNQAAEQVKALKAFLKTKKVEVDFSKSILDEELSILVRYKLIMAWIREFQGAITDDSYETALLFILDNVKTTDVLKVATTIQIEELKGEHQLLEEGYTLDFHRVKKAYDFMVNEAQPDYKAFKEAKTQLLHNFKEEYKLDSFKPEVMNSFVRNKLINNVYLPLVGANLTKQIGGAGENKRIDLMGLLLLISPPGYGKTTLMEYIASRLGLTFMKINGPSIGHSVTSLDPAAAPDATSREEIEKLNFGLELGDNVMIYLDDIQHCNPEFLQKFISLCDAQRTIEGVYKGNTKTYDFRGKKVCVVMAGNPYTESGEKFKIPDMLANRADIYNLGDVIGGNADDFELSYIENVMSSNQTFAALKSKPKEDLYRFVKAAERGEDMVEGLTSNIQNDQITDALKLFKHTLVVRDVVLKVNKQYIHSAGISEEYREEPAFKMQGSYRKMNKMVEKLSPLMTEEEVWVVINSHYQNECQTLTGDAEANFLKLKEIAETITDEETIRWTEIKEVFTKNNKLSAQGGNQWEPAIMELQELNSSIKDFFEWVGRSRPNK